MSELYYSKDETIYGKNMKLIDRKKEIFAVNPDFDRYLRSYGRGNRLDFDYDDLLCFSDSFPFMIKMAKTPCGFLCSTSHLCDAILIELF